MRSWFTFRTRSRDAVDPHEVLLDAHNLPGYNQWQFEGRFERPIRRRSLALIFAAFLVVAGVVAVRAGTLQLVNGAAFAAQSEENRFAYTPLPPERGVLYDRTGGELAWNTPSADEAFASRSYTASSGLAHVLGYVQLPARDAQGFFHRRETVGVAGLERVLQERLAGTPGTQIIETNALGAVQSAGVVEPPEDGEAITLSLDHALSAALSGFIEERVAAGTFQAGAGVLLDVSTGEVLVHTSYPEFSPAVMTSATNTSAIERFTEDPRTVFLDRAAHGLYTPGSIIKPLMALAALEEGVITPEEEIFSSGRLVVPNPYQPDRPTIFRDWQAHGWTDMPTAIAVSSNVYFFEIGGGFGDREGLGITRIERWARLFGLAESTGSVMDPEAHGTIPSPRWKEATFGEDVWRVGDTYNTAIGQYGFQITPLQAVRYVAAIANGGVLPTPRYELGARPETRDLALDPAHLAVVREGMRRSVTEGTARALDFPWLSVAAKTGTAEVGRGKQSMHSWVVGFFPYEEPRFAFAVLMEEAPAGTLQGAPYVMHQFLRWLREHAPHYLESTEP